MNYKIPDNVNPKWLMADDEVEKAIHGLGNTSGKSRLWSHFAVTNAILKDVDRIIAEEKEQARKEASATPVTPVGLSLEEEARLRAELENALQEKEALKAELAQVRLAALTPPQLRGLLPPPAAAGEASPAETEVTPTQDGDAVQEAPGASAAGRFRRKTQHAQDGDTAVLRYNSQGHIQFPNPMLRALGWVRGAKVHLVDLYEDGIIVRLCPQGFEHDGRLQESTGILRIHRAAFARYFSEVKNGIEVTLDLRQGGILVNVD